MSALFLALLLVAAGPADGFARHETSALLDFRYSWPAEAEARPALRAHLADDMARARESALSDAREDVASRIGSGAPHLRHEFAKSWAVAGAATGLVSLTARVDTFTGGAHPNHLFESLLWDDRASAPVDAGEVLGAAAIERLTPRYCAALDRERRERGIPVPGDDDIFPRCPPLSDIVVAPADRDGDGRFERVDFLLAPYDAAPYVAGAFVLTVTLDAGDLALVPGRWRDAFEPARGR